MEFDLGIDGMPSLCDIGVEDPMDASDRGIEVELCLLFSIIARVILSSRVCASRKVGFSPLLASPGYIVV